MERDSSLICVFISFSLNFFNAVSYPPSTRSNCKLSVSFLTKRMSKKLSTKFTQRSDVIPYLNKIFFRINILTLLSKTWWISIHLFSGLQFHFLLSGARKSKGKLDKVAWDKFYALGKKFWTAVWSVNLGWIICTPKECKLTIFKPYAEKFNISVPDHFPA